MSDVIKKEKKEKKQKKEAKEAPVAAASAAMAKQDDGLHIKSEAVTKAIDTKDWPLLLKVTRGESVERRAACAGSLRRGAETASSAAHGLPSLFVHSH